MPKQDSPAVAVFLPSDLLTPQQLAERLQVAETWIYERSRNRYSSVAPIPVIKLGKLLRYHWPSVCEWLAANQKGGRRG